MNNDEKMIAKYLIHTFDSEALKPNLQKISKAASLTENAVRERLAFMAKAGLLQESGDGDLGVTLAEGYKKLNHATLGDFLEQVKKRQAERKAKAAQQKDAAANQANSGDYQSVPADKWGLPDSSTGRAFAAVLEAIKTGDDDCTRKFFEAVVAEDFIGAFPMSEHQKIFRQVHESMGDFEVVSAQKTAENTGEVVIRNKETGKQVKIDLEVEPKEPHGIVSMGVGRE